jgi:polysaccharide export outer membrane protein
MYNSKTVILFSVLVALPLACAHSEPYVWVEDLPKAAVSESQYRIRAGDELSVSVWDQTQISGNVLVRDDGFITLVLVGDVAVAGLTIAEATDIITKKYEGKIVQGAKVTITLRTPKSSFVSVIGEVENPGLFALGPKDNLITMLSKAGGLNEFADSDSIFVLRDDSKLPRIRFDYERLTRSPSGGMNFKLRDGDIVVCE